MKRTLTPWATHGAGVWSVCLGLVLLGVWELAVSYGGWSRLVLPPPSAVAMALWRGWATGYFAPHAWQTLLEVLAGLALGGTWGLVGGLALGESAFWRRVLMPYVVTTQVLPKLALAPLLMMWLGFGTWPMVVITALVCFFPLLENTLTGLQQVDSQRLAMFRLLGASRWQTLWRLKVPMALPAMLAGWRVAVVLSLVGAVVGEFIGANQGLGALIIAAQGTMDTPLMFAVLAQITVLGLVLYQATLVLEHRLLLAFFPLKTGD